MDEEQSFEQARAEFTALLKASRAILENRDFSGAAEAIFKACQEITGATAGYIALVEGGENALAFIDSGEHACQVDPSLPMPIRGMRAEVFQKGETIYENDFPNSEWNLALPEGHAVLENVLFALLVVQGSPVGLLGLGNKAGGFTANDAKLASAFAEMAAIALVNSQAEQALHETHHKLETLVQERTQQLNQVVEELQAELAERKRIEARLRLQETALESSISGILITDTQGNIQWSNPAFSKMSGYSSEGVLGLNMRILNSGKQEPSFYEEMWSTILSGKMWNGELVNRHKDGRLYHVEETITPILGEDGSVLRFVSINKDITQDKKTQLELQQNEKLLRLIIETMPVGLVIIDQTGQIMLANQESHKVWGGAKYVGMDEYSQYKAWSLETGKRLQTDDWAAVQALDKGQPVLNQELEIETFDGTHKFILNSAVPYLNERGEVIGAIVINQDITTLKNSEKILADEKAKLKNILDSMMDGIYIVDPDHNITYANPVILKDFGSPERRKCYEYLHNRTETCSWCVNEQVFSGEVVNRELSSPETGKVYDLYDTPLRNPDGSVYNLKQLHDITRRKLIETQLEENNKYLFTLSQRERSQRQLAESLATGSQALSQSLDLDTVANTLLDLLERMVPFDKAWIFTIEEGERLFLQAARGIDWESDSFKASLPLPKYEHFQEILKRQESLINSSCLDDHGLESSPECGTNFTWLGVPLIAAGNVLGICVLAKYDQDQYMPGQIPTVQAIVSQAAVAIQNARLFQAELHARQTAETLRQASLNISQSLEMEAVLNQVLESLTSLIPYDAAMVVLLDSDSQFIVHTTRGDLNFTPGNEDSLKYLNHGILTQDLMANSEGILINDTHAYLDIQSCPFPRCMRSWILMPLKAGKQVFGFYLLQKAQPDAFSQEQFRLVEALVSQAAIAGQNAWLFEQVRYGHERLMDLSRRMVQVQENERSYIARELHDESGQALASLLLGLDLVERSAHEPEKVIEAVTRLEGIVNGIMENLHRIAMNLRPATLDHLGLANALNQYIQSFSQAHSIQAKFDTSGFNDRLPSEIEVAFYRITQEALTNVVRHARATRIEVEFEQTKESLILMIKDNGIGFDPKAKVDRNRLGLVGMRERASMLGGQMLVESKPGQGATLKIEIPWSRPDLPSQEQRQEMAS
jgi:PAS domain S-box-containing protein